MRAYTGPFSIRTYQLLLCVHIVHGCMLSACLCSRQTARIKKKSTFRVFPPAFCQLTPSTPREVRAFPSIGVPSSHRSVRPKWSNKGKLGVDSVQPFSEPLKPSRLVLTTENISMLLYYICSRPQYTVTLSVDVGPSDLLEATQWARPGEVMTLSVTSTVYLMDWQTVSLSLKSDLPVSLVVLENSTFYVVLIGSVSTLIIIIIIIIINNNNNTTTVIILIITMFRLRDTLGTWDEY